MSIKIFLSIPLYNVLFVIREPLMSEESINKIMQLVCGTIRIVRKEYTMSKERSIIMSVESVRAILAGWKTQTRRVCKYPLEHNILTFTNKDGVKKYLFDKWRLAPYQVGDRLLVKESYLFNDNKIWYKADYSDLESEKILRIWSGNGKWQNPMFMPREYSRLTLAVTDVRLERLQNIPNVAIMQEGCPYSSKKSRTWTTNERLVTYGMSWYSTLWDKLNGKRGFPWKSNPWVWVIEFKRVKKENNL